MSARVGDRKPRLSLTGLHLLLTYRCTLECAHCFVWGSPWQTGTMTLSRIRRILDEAEGLGTIEWIYFEGGEPFLHYALLLEGVREAVRRGFRVGIVSNAYWATDVADALTWLKPFEGLVQDLSISSDRFHSGDRPASEEESARAAAKELGIPLGVIRVAQPGEGSGPPSVGQLPPEGSAVMYRGRAAERLASRPTGRAWRELAGCPYEDLRNPERIHVDPFGNLHVCQGISIGNLFRARLREICATYDPDSHPIVGAILAGGPAELARRYDFAPRETYADECHLCYEARRALRPRLPETLTPGQMYGVGGDP